LVGLALNCVRLYYPHCSSICHNITKCGTSSNLSILTCSDASEILQSWSNGDHVLFSIACLILVFSLPVLSSPLLSLPRSLLLSSPLSLSTFLTCSQPLFFKTS